MSQALSDRRVLIVDDEEDVQALIGHVLWDAGCEVEFAATGTAALRRAQLGGLDLVVLDLVLPDLDGHLVLQRIRALPAAPPVVVVSVRADYGSFARALREGAESYLVKPFKVRELLATCQGILLGGRPAERRREPRQSVAGEVRIMGLDGEQLTLGELVDLSPTGAQVKLGTPLQPRAGVRLAMRSPEGSFDVEGRVAWLGLAAQGFAHGLGFVNLTPEHEGRLRALLGPSV
jgi:DNA-binding response OmpR family regulator